MQGAVHSTAAWDPSSIGQDRTEMRTSMQAQLRPHAQYQQVLDARGGDEGGGLKMTRCLQSMPCCLKHACPRRALACSSLFPFSALFSQLSLSIQSLSFSPDAFFPLSPQHNNTVQYPIPLPQVTPPAPAPPPTAQCASLRTKFICSFLELYLFIT